MVHFPTPDPVSSSDLTRYLLAPNPGPMSLEGTNSYLIAAPAGEAVGEVPGKAAGVPGERPVVVVDPGPLDEGHLAALAGAGHVELVLITHRHRDHTEASRRLHQLTGAPVRAMDPDHCHGGAQLVDGEEIFAAGVTIRVIATPGHTSDSVCFLLPDDGATGSILTGDTILGRGTTIIDYPDGRLGPYLDSLAKLSALGPAKVLPAHGPTLPDLALVSRHYSRHRAERLDQVRAALADIGPGATVQQVTDVVYADVDASVRRAAEASVAAQLDYLGVPG